MLAVPILVALKVAGEHVEGWRAVSEFLSPNPQWRPLRVSGTDGLESRRGRIALTDRAQPG
jgi:hypothetical protein